MMYTGKMVKNEQKVHQIWDKITWHDHHGLDAHNSCPPHKRSSNLAMENLQNQPIKL